MLKSVITRFSEAERIRYAGLRFITTLLLMALCVILPCSYAYADKEDGTLEEITEDDQGGTAVTDDDFLIEDDETDDDYFDPSEEGTKKVSGKIGIDAHCVYDYDNEVYRFNYTSYEEDDVTANVYTGMYTKDTVHLTVGNNLKYKLFHEGVEVEEPKISKLTDTGYYALQLLKGNGDVEEVINFTIIGDYSNLTTMTMPDMFRIKKVTLNEEEIKVKGQTLTFDEEGEYDIEYICIANQISYHIMTRIDHTSPVLALEGVNDKGYARQSVSLKDLENGVNMIIYLDGEKISNTSVLKEFGKYDIILEDKAGNVTEYKFEIMMYISGSGIIFMVMFIMIFVGLGVYITISKKKMRIR